MGREYGRALPLDTKAAGDAWEVRGYLSTFGNVDAGGDLILPTAFDRSLQSGRKVKFLFAHDDRMPLGPPLTLTKDDHGLIAHGRLSKTPLGQDVHTWLVDGAVDSWSIGYWPTSFEFREGEDGSLVRVLKQIDLLEGSIVAVPMNEEAVVTGVKSLETGEPVPEGKPLPNEHACRLRDPGAFQPDSFRRVQRESGGKRYSVIMGRLQGETTMTEQAYRYPKDVWAASEARSHCSSHDGTFEAAAESDSADTSCVCHGGRGLAFAAHAAQVGQAVQEFVARTEAALARPADKGDEFAAARFADIAHLGKSLQDAHAALAALTVAHEPKSYATEWALLQTRLRLAGVEV